ncbi:MAG: hypothetical protein AAGI52_04920 [Bacteroidota bacterium]
MRHHQKDLGLEIIKIRIKLLPLSLLLLALLQGCDQQAAAPGDIAPTRVSIGEELSAIHQEVIQPMQARVVAMEKAEIERMAALADEAQRALASGSWVGGEERAIQVSTELDVLVNGLVTDEEMHRLETLSASMFEKRPELREMGAEGIMSVAVSEGILNSIQDDCEALCAATAGFQIVAIEAGFVGAAIGCAALTAGYGFCIGAAIIAKNAGIAAVATGLASCVGGC